ncbi:HAD-like domain-containing protein [Lasiosphaeris hirsuta]|uniref:HAD-like domain-containing protein n=1 Tax=Lasiosphaeris hirsuta TaxID=260670 RepID=A0AA40AGU5_9PEZI|nr:HAD-like domain-containing protein [Lasiosphaeris hirsuta]
MAPRTDFPPVRACLFDMDGLLLDTEDLYTLCVNLVLEKYGRPKLPWTIKAKLQGRPGPDATRIFHDWAQLPISLEQYAKEFYALQAQHFPGTQPLPGIEKLLSDLARTRYWEVKKEDVVKDNVEAIVDKENKNPDADVKATVAATAVVLDKLPSRVHIALATSSHETNFRLKTSHLEELFSVFEGHRRVLGDDRRIPPGRGKPLPDIYLLALKTVNDSLPAGEAPIKPEECLVFEDSVPGVEAGRRAGMRVIWCPHPMLKNVYLGREAEVLAGLTGQAGNVDLHDLGEPDDGWADYYPTLIDFPYAKYGIEVPLFEVESEPAMQMGAQLDDGEVLQVVEGAATAA